ncbi:uncharacterized protein UTRI_10481_B [Ustilago trichophora]|uniref:Uncharacterized protein n=1 Tax=Ustilago trichophora TaxID=86804 RepID=A0A5C3ECX7_9BASI|nr:uncharacterized protein UTRI_10481_B [Ustilago trichophora]
MKLSVLIVFLFTAFFGTAKVASAPLGSELAENAVKGAARAVEAHTGSASRGASTSKQLKNQHKSAPAKAASLPPQPKKCHIPQTLPIAHIELQFHHAITSSSLIRTPCFRQVGSYSAFIADRHPLSQFLSKSMRISSIIIYLAAIIGARNVASAPLASAGLLKDAAKGEDSFRAALDRLPRINTQRHGATVDNYEIERHEVLRTLRKMDQDLLTPVRKPLPRIRTVRKALEAEIPRRIRLLEISHSNGIFMKPIDPSNPHIGSLLHSAEYPPGSSAASSPLYTARTSPTHSADDSLFYSAHSSPRYKSSGDFI